MGGEEKRDNYSTREIGIILRRALGIPKKLDCLSMLRAEGGVWVRMHFAFKLN